LGLLLLALSLAFTADWLRAAQVYLNPEQRLDFFSDHPDWFDKAHSSSWFSKYTEFAQLSTTELTADNAAQELARAQRLLHYSSEVRVLRRASDAAALLGNPSLAAHYQTLLKRRWPQAPRPQQPQPLPAQASDH
jgi:O-antigen polymerase